MPTVVTHSHPAAVGGVDVEFPDVCRHYLGQRAYVVAMMFSVLTLLGASMVYWVNVPHWPAAEGPD